jgi:hypothetical protein
LQEGHSIKTEEGVVYTGFAGILKIVDAVATASWRVIEVSVGLE